MILCFQVAAPGMAVAPKPNFPGPHNFLAYTVTVGVICFFLNILSLGLSIPAVVCAVMVNSLVCLTLSDSCSYLYLIDFKPVDGKVGSFLFLVSL